MSEPSFSAPARHWPRRFHALTLAATYFGWAWLALTTLWGMVYDPTFSNTSEWWGIEGEVLVYSVALLGPALLIFPLSIGLLMSPRPWIRRVATGLCAIQILLLLAIIAPASDSRELLALAPAISTAVLCFGIGLKPAAPEIDHRQST